MNWPEPFSEIYNSQNPVASFLAQEGPAFPGWDCLGPGLGCPSECTNPNVLFGNTTTPSAIWPCAIWANVTTSQRQGQLSAVNDTFLATHQVNLSQEWSKNVTYAISDCLLGYCQVLDGCPWKNGLSRCSTQSLVINGTMLNQDALGACWSDICEHQHAARTNPDIAGIGVVVAYLLQNVLALTSVIICIAFLAWFGAIRPYLEKRGKSMKASKTDKVMRRLWSACTSSLGELLKAQCFFSLAILLAIEVELRTENALTPLDIYSLGAAGLTGLAPVAYTFSALCILYHRTGPPWGLSLLTFTTWIWSLKVLLQSQFMNHPFLNSQTDEQWPDACSNLPPSNLCGSAIATPDTFYYNPIFNMAVKVLATFCVTVSIALIFLGWARSSRLPAAHRRGYWAAMLLWTQFLTHAVMPVALVAEWQFINSLLQIGAVNMSWSFGQVIATTFWAPVFVKFTAKLMRDVPERLVARCCRKGRADASDQVDLAWADSWAWRPQCVGRCETRHDASIDDLTLEKTLPKEQDAKSVFADTSTLGLSSPRRQDTGMYSIDACTLGTTLPTERDSKDVSIEVSTLASTSRKAQDSRDVPG